MSASVIFFLILGLVLLVGRADLLVRGASRLALRFGISPLVIGLTVVAFGTSAPELAVSVQSGLAALITPLVVSQQLVRIDVPLVIAASVLLWIMAFDGLISLFDGLLLTAGIVAYTVFAIQQSRKESAAVQTEYEQEFGEEKIPGWRGCRFRLHSSSAAWRCWCLAPTGWSTAQFQSPGRWA